MLVIPKILSGSAVSDNLYVKGLQSEATCLVEVLHFEAGGERYKGQIAVAQVVLNRVKSPLYKGRTICEIIAEPWQFSYRNNKGFQQLQFKPSRTTLQASWDVMQGQYKKVISEGIMHYHTHRVSPKWSKGKKSVTIQNHKFFNLN